MPMSVFSTAFWFACVARKPNALKTLPAAATVSSGMGENIGSARNCVRQGSRAT